MAGTADLPRRVKDASGVAHPVVPHGVKVKITEGVQRIWNTGDHFADGMMAEDTAELGRKVGDFVLGHEIHGTSDGGFRERGAFAPTGIDRTRRDRFRVLASVDELAEEAIPRPQDHVSTPGTDLDAGEGLRGFCAMLSRVCPTTPSAQPALTVPRPAHLGSGGN